jgi:MoxR-like ATPase
MEAPKETKKKKNRITPEVRRATSPLLLLRKSFTGDLPDETVKLSQDQVKEKCFEVLGLMEEYYREPSTAEDFERTRSGFEGTDELDEYLELLEEGDDVDMLDSESSTEAQPSKISLVKQHRDLIKSRIRQLLAVTQVKNSLRSELAKELSKFKNAKSKLQRLQKIKRAIEYATFGMHSAYLESKKKHRGVLVESAGKKIEKLSKIVEDAKTEETNTIKTANDVERGFMTTQELLAYKRQMAQRGFALTPSRRALLQKIVEHSMSGQKVFLVGSTGTGKTELAFYAVNEVTGDYEIIPWHEGTVMKDVLGQMQLTQNAEGQVESSFKPGPLVRGYTKGRGVIHEEITAGSTRTMMGMKPYLNLRPGQPFKIPEMNGTILKVDEEILMEVFTGNPKSEQTTEREDLDPAILRMMKGIQVEYMPPDEMAKIVVAKLMEESGLLKLPRSDIDLIEKLADAAHLMQMCHENTIEGEAADALREACGIDDLRITKNFLDSGSFLGLFAKYDYERRKGKSLRTYLREQLYEFLHDPKNMNVPEEKSLSLGILTLKGVLDKGSTLEEVKIAPRDVKYVREKPYILPSEMGFLSGEQEVLDEDPLADDSEAEAGIRNVFGEIKGMLGGTAEVVSNPTDISAMKKVIDGYNLPPQSKEKLKEMFEGYDEALATARELDPNVKTKSFAEFCTAFFAFGINKIKEIAEFGRPMVLVTPKNSFLDKKAGMDRNKKYVDAAGQQQDDAYHFEDENSPYKNVAIPAKTEISIVDGSTHMPHIPGISSNSRFDERKRLFKDHYAKKGMRLINVHEYAALLQRSLREYQQNGNDVSKIVDFYQNSNDTVTCLDDTYLTNCALVAFGDFYSINRRADFSADRPAFAGVHLRGRSSVQVLEY